MIWCLLPGFILLEWGKQQRFGKKSILLSCVCSHIKPSVPEIIDSGSTAVLTRIDTLPGLILTILGYISSTQLVMWTFLLEKQIPLFPPRRQTCVYRWECNISRLLLVHFYGLKGHHMATEMNPKPFCFTCETNNKQASVWTEVLLMTKSI